MSLPTPDLIGTVRRSFIPGPAMRVVVPGLATEPAFPTTLPARVSQMVQPSASRPGQEEAAFLRGATPTSPGEPPNSRRRAPVRPLGTSETHCEYRSKRTSRSSHSTSSTDMMTEARAVLRAGGPSRPDLRVRRLLGNGRRLGVYGGRRGPRCPE
jgi:hypothetical protein